MRMLNFPEARQETDSDLTTSSDPKRSPFSIAWRIVNYIAGALSLAILAMAIPLPSEVGGGAEVTTEHRWQVAAVVAFILGLLVVIKRTNYALVLLIGSCAFFFVSCSFNFHWRGG